MNEFLRAIIIIISVLVISGLVMLLVPQVRETPSILIVVAFVTLWIVRSFLPR